MTHYAPAPQQMRVPNNWPPSRNREELEAGRARRRLPGTLAGRRAGGRRAISQVLWNHKIKKQVSAVGDVEMQMRTDANRPDK